MTEIAIIGGTGLTRLQMLEITKQEMVHTPYGEPSGAITYGRLCHRDVAFLARHGDHHTISPHKVNYRANLWALQSVGVRKVIAVAAVGGIRADLYPSRLAIPDQIIDYTWGRYHTFFEEDSEPVTHVDFTWPYCHEIRASLLQGAHTAGLEVSRDGTYGATQGPRLETAREIDRMERDGCDMVGMTGMPEAALARELELCYGTCAVVANWAAGRGGQEKIALEEIHRSLQQGMERVTLLLEYVLPRL